MNIGWIMELLEDLRYSARIIEQVVDTKKTADDCLMLDSNVWKRKSKIVHFGKSTRIDDKPQVETIDQTLPRMKLKSEFEPIDQRLQELSSKNAEQTYQANQEKRSKTSIVPSISRKSRLFREISQ